MLSKRKKPVTKGHMLSYPIYMKVQDHSGDSIIGYQGWERRGRLYRFLCRTIEVFWNLVVVVVVVIKL